jgi:hypothetical protein
LDRIITVCLRGDDGDSNTLQGCASDARIRVETDGGTGFDSHTVRSRCRTASGVIEISCAAAATCIFFERPSPRTTPRRASRPVRTFRPIASMAFSLCVAAGGVARAAPSRRSASRSASRRSHITRCAEPISRRSDSVAPRVTRRAFGAGAALLATGIESSTKAARAFERPPPGTSQTRSRDRPMRRARERSLIVRVRR